MATKRERRPAREDPGSRETLAGTVGEPRARDQFGHTPEQIWEGRPRHIPGQTPAAGFGAGSEGAEGAVGEQVPPTPEDLLIRAEEEDRAPE